MVVHVRNHKMHCYCANYKWSHEEVSHIGGKEVEAPV